MKIWISAGEVSGDRLGAELARALLRSRPDLRVAGCAGPAMRAAGVEGRFDASRFAYAGWSSVLRALPRLARDVGAVSRAVEAFGPDLFVAVDAPGLNGRLVCASREQGRRCAWLAPPQLWAWRRRSVPALQDLDAYPLHAFEAPALRDAGARVHWHGFPGPRRVRDRNAERDLLVLLPGARPAWRRRHEGLFREAARRADLGLEVVVAVPDGTLAGPGEMGVDAALRRAALALAMPGTGVLEAALEGVPTLVAARPGAIDLWIARRRLRSGDLSLPNRILGRSALPELLGRPTSDAIASGLRDLRRRGEEVARELEGLREAMGSPAAMDAIAEDLLELPDLRARDRSSARLSYL